MKQEHQGWSEETHPNPGPALAFRAGLPYGFVDPYGVLRIVRDADTLARFQGGHA